MFFIHSSSSAWRSVDRPLRGYRLRRTLLSALVGGIVIAIPWISSEYFVMMSIRVMFFGMLTMSLTYLAGELGAVSLMQAAFFGISGYSVAVLQSRYGFPFPIPLLAGLVIAVLAAGLFGLLVVRVRGIYFLMLTLVLGQLVWALASQWSSVTKGGTGIMNIYAPVVLGISTEKSKTAFYFFQLIFFWYNRFKRGIKHPSFYPGARNEIRLHHHGQ